MTAQMTAEETQAFMRNLAASTSRSVLESLEAARKHGISADTMRRAISEAVSDHVTKPLMKDEPVLKEFAADPIATSKKYEKMKIVEGEYLSVTQQLQDAKLLDASNRWINGSEPDSSTLSPELQRAVKRFDAAREAALKAGVLAVDEEKEAVEMTTMMHLKAISKHAAHMALRSPTAEDSTFRSIMNSHMDIDAKLAIILIFAPVMVAWTPIAYAISKGIEKSAVAAEIKESVTETLNAPEVLNNQPLLEGPRYTQLLEWMKTGNTTIEALESNECRLLAYKTPDVLHLHTLTTPPTLSPCIELVSAPTEKVWSAVDTPEDLARARTELEESYKNISLSKGASI